MFYPFHRFQFLNIPAFLLGMLTIAAAKPDPVSPDRKNGKPQLRIVCVSSLSENQEVILASRDDEGDWQERGTVELRTSFITDWLPAQVGELHLAVREEGILKSIGHFTYPEGTQKALAVLLSDPVKNRYSVDVIDTAKLKFTKGSALLVNYSSSNGAVVLGSLKTGVEPGERMIVKPIPEANGMYRMMVAYAPTDKELVPCYDRYVSNNPDARDIIFLLPDQTLGLKVFSLSEFGPFD